MPRVVGVHLEVGRTSTSEFARARATVRFSDIEVELNVPCTVMFYLWEQDESLDQFLATTSTFMSLPGPPQPRGDEDDFVGTIDFERVTPDGRSSVLVEVEREFDFGDQESGDEEYRAVVYAIPDIRTDVALSEIVSINLG